MPQAIERLESRPVTRMRLPSSSAIAESPGETPIIAEPRAAPNDAAPRVPLNSGDMRSRFLLLVLLACGLAGCGRVWNDPYPAEDRGRNVLYTFFIERPKHLDPAQSYTSDEYD